MDLDNAEDEVVRRLATGGRPSGDRIPILALTRRGDLKTKLAAFDLGVDDIMALPMSPDELLARVLVLTRRGLGIDVALVPVQKVGELEIDILHRHFRAGGLEITLSGLSQNLLYLLAAKPGQVVTRRDIQDALWGVDFVSDPTVVERQVRGLRANLRDVWWKPRFIAIEPKQGYRFIPTLADHMIEEGQT